MTSALLDIAGIAVSPDHYIDGHRVASGETFELHSPIDQQLLGRIGEGQPEHVEAAIKAAQKAFPAWSGMTAAQRKPGARSKSAAPEYQGHVPMKTTIGVDHAQGAGGVSSSDKAERK